MLVGSGGGGVPTEFRWDGEEGGAEGRSQTTGQRVEVIGDPAPWWREFRRRAPDPETLEAQALIGRGIMITTHISASLIAQIVC